ncbi:MAG: hypothetical protein AAGA78_08895, partial [Pseudomonadota bacterium]
MHLGLGAFFRAHGAIYTQDAAEPGWGILGVSLRSPKVRDQLAGQDWLYTAVERGPEGNRPRVVEQLTSVLCAPEEPSAVVAALASPETKLVTLTVTEKGYCHDPATGALNRQHPDILADLAGQPRSALGYLVAGLAARRAAGLAPFTVLSCDNIPANGRVLRGLVLELAKLQDADLADWIEDKGRFPSSMVDRIVPATTQADLDSLEGVQDQSPVFHEPFRQWVLDLPHGAWCCTLDAARSPSRAPPSASSSNRIVDSLCAPFVLAVTINLGARRLLWSSRGCRHGRRCSSHPSM